MEVHCLPPSHALFLHLLNLSAFERFSKEPRKRSPGCQRAPRLYVPVAERREASIRPSICERVRSGLIFASLSLSLFFPPVCPRVNMQTRSLVQISSIHVCIRPPAGGMSPVGGLEASPACSTGANWTLMLFLSGADANAAGAAHQSRD